MSEKTDDRSYKGIFGALYMLREFIQTFVDEPWVETLETSNLELMGTEFVDKRLIASSQDLLFKVKREEDPALFVVMLEFQKKPDKYMALRMLHYLCTVYLSLLGRDRKQRNSLLREGKLPPLFPVVLYKGRRVWGAAKEVSELIDSGFWEEGERLGFLRQYMPRFRYLCIDQERLSDEFLEEKGTLVSALFFMERVGRDGIESEKEDLARVARLMEPHLKSDEGRRTVWRILERFRVLSGLGKMENREAVVAKLESIVEVKTMLEETMEKIKAKARHEGEVLGMEKGKIEGKMEQKVETAIRLLNKGHTPQEVAEIVDLPEEEIKKLLH